MLRNLSGPPPPTYWRGAQQLENGASANRRNFRLVSQRKVKTVYITSISLEIVTNNLCIKYILVHPSLSRFPKLTRPYYNVCPVPSRSLISVQTFCTKTALYGVAKKLNILQNTVLHTPSDWDPLTPFENIDYSFRYNIRSRNFI